MVGGRRQLVERLRRAGGMERFVRLIVGGGVALVAGLWFAALAPVGSVAWSIGGLLALVGAGGLVVGIWSEIDAPRP